MANNSIIGSPLNELPERLNYYDTDIDTFSKKKARLFPSGTSIKKTKETNLTSIFLSNLAAIRPYRESLLSVLNPKTKKVSNKTAQIHVFTEINSLDSEGACSDKGRPDGLIVLTTGKAQTIEWAAFVEVKVNSELELSQIQRYLDIAKTHEVDLITISDQIVSTPFQHPLQQELNNRKTNLYHWSWIYIRTKAQQVLESASQTGCETTYDVDQIYILNEFIRYLDDPKINVGHFTHMGKPWSQSVKDLRQSMNGSKLPTQLLETIATAWMHEEQDLCFHIYLKTKLKTYLALTKKEKSNLEARKEKIFKSLQKDKCISSAYLVPQSTSIQDALESSKRKTVTLSICFLSSSLHLKTEVEICKDQKAIGQTSTFINKLEKNEIGMEDEIKLSAIYKWNKRTEPTPFKTLQDQKKHKTEYSTVNKLYGDTIEKIELSQHVDLNKSIFASPTKFISNIETAVTNYIQQIFNA
ncbi:hypothetical protein [uncultured Pseudodesulfovibrio sp.]|uniref:hypothetical protein n=1 Tax=uncultured Pseudodesulfovibrio sp. TaxID=2035858 RepID=UPI0029C6C1F8|nr:hypothetical protein [uncultured Pseudodesulfovibrio sp.]